LPFPSSVDALPFWRITAAAQSAELRLHAYPEKAFVPVKFLRALAAEEMV
jgi:hypothetical protein